uniref:Uncharacterized protein n=1 Tax=Triticum urartu TaxID=4572 RepID=A0A8R7TF21_TRIUA
MNCQCLMVTVMSIVLMQDLKTDQFSTGFEGSPCVAPVPFLSLATA